MAMITITVRNVASGFVFQILAARRASMKYRSLKTFVLREFGWRGFWRPRRCARRLFRRETYAVDPAVRRTA